jgi:hypothetical protein
MRKSFVKQNFLQKELNSAFSESTQKYSAARSKSKKLKKLGHSTKFGTKQNI